MSDPGEISVVKGAKGSYRIERLVAAEPVCFVYEAVETGVGTPVRAFQIKPEYTKQPEYFTRFQNDARRLVRLRHPGLIEVLDYTADDPERCYLITAQPLVTDIPLTQLLEKSPNISAKQALGLIGLIGEALAAAHGEGLVHCDLRPERILLSISPTGKQSIKVVGFGLAQPGFQLAPQGPSMAYAPPEQLMGEPVDARTDQFAFAAIAYEVLTGHKAFVQPKDTEAEVRARILTWDPSLAVVNHPRQREIQRAFQKAFSKNRQQRHLSIHEFCQELGVTETTPVPHISVPHPVRRRRRITRRQIAGVGGLGLSLLIVLVLILRREQLPKPHEAPIAQPKTQIPSQTAPELAPVDSRPAEDAATARPSASALAGFNSPDSGTAKASLSMARNEVPFEDNLPPMPPALARVPQQPVAIDSGSRSPSQPGRQSPEVQITINVQTKDTKPKVLQQLPKPDTLSHQPAKVLRWTYKTEPNLGPGQQQKLIRECLAPFSQTFRIEVEWVGDRYSVMQWPSGGDLQRSDSLRTCLRREFPGGSLPHPLTVSRSLQPAP